MFQIIKQDDDQDNDLVRFTKNSQLLDIIREFVNDERVYDDTPEVDVSTLLLYFPNFKSVSSKSRKVIEFIKFLEEASHRTTTRAKNLLKKGKVSFNLLPVLFTNGTEIVVEALDGSLQGGIIVNTDFKSSIFGKRFQIEYEYAASDGKELSKKTAYSSITEFTNTRNLTDLQVRPITNSEKKKLTERGKRYSKISLGANYLQHSGQMLVKRWWDWQPLRSHGRVMVDIQSYDVFSDTGELKSSSSPVNNAVTEETAWWMFPPYLFGFSFVTKEWGKFNVDNLSEIDFKTQAFEQLVLPKDKKDLVRALVENTANASVFTDIIDGKGGGCIFLLHGEPGTGKTLTAEAVAEFLKRPLYSVGVGELGTNAEQIEESLRQILDTVELWNAVLLIDEADIFLEKRSSGDIVRNACTSVFLRLLEYHQGVMFLTTNRVEEFDPAFYSRISIALQYDGLNKNSRSKIWHNLLNAADIHDVDIEKLSGFSINGRQIKNSIRIAKALAVQNNAVVSTEHLMQVVQLGQQFITDRTLI